MLELFSGRELAIGVYIILIIISLFLSKKIRPSAINVIKAACCHQLIIPLIIMLGYAGVATYGLCSLMFWQWRYLKDIIIWIIFVGVPTCYKAVDNKEDHYFRNIVVDNFKFSAIVEFISGTFTFPFITELIIQPVIMFVFLLQAIAEREEKYKEVKKLLDWVIAIGGLILTYYTVKVAISTYSELGTVDLIVSFAIPILFSIAYLPVAYLLAVYAKYQVIFIRMNWKLPSSQKVKRKYRLKVLFTCKLSYKRICRFGKEYTSKIYATMTESEFEKIIRDFCSATNKVCH